MDIHESGENYLEMILMLQRKNGKVRAIDVANALNFSKPSVSRGISILKAQDYVTLGESGELILTSDGQEIAERIYERHIFLTNFLKNIGVEEITAEEEACRIEHNLSKNSFECLKKYIENKK